MANWEGNNFPCFFLKQIFFRSTMIGTRATTTGENPTEDVTQITITNITIMTDLHLTMMLINDYKDDDN